MSEQKRFSVYEFDFTIMLFLAFVGILIKIIFENTSLKTSNVGTASASISSKRASENQRSEALDQSDARPAVRHRCRRQQLAVCGVRHT